MAEPQTIVYKVLVNGTDFSSDFLGGGVTAGANQFSTAQFGLDNKEQKHQGSPDIVGGNQVLISGSVDGGSSFVRLFSGSILRRGTKYGANDPELIEVQARDDRFNHLFVTFNNALQKGKNIGEVFSGSPNDSQGNGWFNQDAEGNWPDGLLRDTGFAYDASSVQDIYGGVDDIVSFVHGNTSLAGAVNVYRKMFALDYFTDVGNSQFIVLDHNADYPASSFVLDYAGGEDINKSSLEVDSTDKVSGVIVVGVSPIWYCFGDPPFKYVSDEEITTFPNARQRAEMEFNTFNADQLRGTIASPPVTESVLGKKITVSDSSHGWTGVGNVVGMRHTIGPERWTTQLQFENAPRMVSQTLEEVLENIDELQDKENKGSLYEGFLKVDKNTLSATASRSGQTLAAMVYGSSTIAAGEPDPQATVGVVPVNLRVEGAKAAYFKVSQLDETLDFTGSSLVIKELAFITNLNDGAAYETVQDIEIIGGPNANGQVFTFSLDRYTDKINWIEFNGPMRKANSPNATVDSFFATDAERDSHITSSFWESSNVEKVTLSEERGRASWDKFSKSAPSEYLSRTFSLGTADNWFGFLVTMNVGSSQTALNGFEEMISSFRARTDHKRQVDGLQYNAWRLMFWNNDTENWSLWGRPFSDDVGKWLFHNRVVVKEGLAVPFGAKYFDSDGNIRFQLTNDWESAADADAIMDWAYGHVYFHLEDNPTLIEKATIRRGAKMAVEYPIDVVYGLFSASDGSGDNLFTKYHKEIVAEVRFEDVIVWGYGPGPEAIGDIGRVEILDADFNSAFEVEGNTLVANPPKDWNFIISEWRRLFGSHVTKNTLFLKYSTFGKLGKPTRLNLEQGVIIDRDSSGDTADTMVLQMPEDTSQQIIPYRTGGSPQYASMSFSHYAKTSLPAEGAYARLTDNVGFDKTPEKVLNVLFIWPDGATENVGGGGRGARGTGDVNLYPV